MKQKKAAIQTHSLEDKIVGIPLDQKYWNDQYQNNTTGWNLGVVSPPIKSYIDSITNKNISILIPGCGNAYEADYLLEKGFSNITVIDIAPLLIEKLKNKYDDNTTIKVILGDFEHHQRYDLIIEQTFFCALPSVMRQQYVLQMQKLLNINGLLIGLLFNRTFEKGPPFGGNKMEYELLFKDTFEIKKLVNCKNSFPARENTELWIELKKK